MELLAARFLIEGGHGGVATAGLGIRVPTLGTSEPGRGAHGEATLALEPIAEAGRAAAALAAA